MILFRSAGWDQDLSPEQMQQILDGVYAWFDRLYAEGIAKAAQPLHEEGKVVSGKNGSRVSDGPFAESKETIGGYLIMEAGSLEDAVAIARTWPMLERGCSVEVRPVASRCPGFDRLEKLQQAQGHGSTSTIATR